jgi:hypothetical protein
MFYLYPRIIKVKLQNLRRISGIFVTFIIITGFYGNLFSQANTSASVSATIVEPITQTKTVDINFRTGAVIFAGTLTMVPGKIHPGTPNIMLPVPEGIFTAAAFISEGTAGYSYTITVPLAPLQIKSGKNNLVVDSFTKDPVLNQESGLFSGVYVSYSSLNVTVNYN